MEAMARARIVIVEINIAYRGDYDLIIQFVARGEAHKKARNSALLSFVSRLPIIALYCGYCIRRCGAGQAVHRKVCPYVLTRVYGNSSPNRDDEKTRKMSSVAFWSRPRYQDPGQQGRGRR